MDATPVRNTETVLVVVAHADDETLGMGGTIARHIAYGDSVYVISMTDGVGAREGVTSNDQLLRHQAASAAAETLGFTWLHSYDFPDNRMDTVPILDVVQCIERAKASVNPQLIYTHSGADLNVDHRVVSQAVLTAFRPLPGEVWREIRAFEVASATEFGHSSLTASFNPNLYIDISPYWQSKQAGLQAYALEMRASPHARSMEGLESLAKLRGCQVGLIVAEAFEILRSIQR